MHDLCSLKRDIATLFETGKTICLWFSGGSDSRLLLEAMQGYEFGILRFEDGWSRDQRQASDAALVDKHQRVFAYPAIGHTMTGENGKISLVSQYAVDQAGSSVMLVRDLVEDEARCAFDIRIEAAKQRSAPIEFDLHIWGTRGDDMHWLKDEPLLTAKDWKVGRADFTAPLAGWTRSEVIAALKECGIDQTAPDEKQDTGNIACCFRCLASTGKVYCPKEKTEIDPVAWNATANTEKVRQLLRS